jgi:photosystem II stability/assembly factor-like uncharacterized protein
MSAMLSLAAERRSGYRHARALAPLVLVFGLLAGSPNTARAETGYQDLDNAAVMVKLPQRTALIALARAGQRIIAVGVHGVIITSDDNGASWRQASVPVDVTLTSVYFRTAQEGWAVGHYGVVLHTVDGGSSWDLALTGLDVIKAMQQVAQRMQVASPAAADTILQTKVATVFNRGGPDQPFLSVGACGAGILAVGAKDMAMYSADNGKTWQDWTPNVVNPKFRMIYDLFDAGEQPVLVGETGLVAFGDTACSTLQALPTTSMPTLFGGLTLSNGVLLVYGLNGAVFTTHDKGVTWQQAEGFPPQAVITSGIVDSTRKILLSALSGQIYVSSDNGATFQRSNLSVPFQIASLIATPDNRIVVAGNGGVAVLADNSIH